MECAPYTYLWNTEEKHKSIYNLYSGYYEVFVYDNNQCLTIDSITLTQPTELFFDLEYFIDTCNRGVGKSEFIAQEVFLHIMLFGQMVLQILLLTIYLKGSILLKFLMTICV